jgi:hypothetical protein
LQKLQLHRPTHSGARGTAIRTAPQWHEPSTAIGRSPRHPFNLTAAARMRQANFLCGTPGTAARNHRSGHETVASAAHEFGMQDVRLQALLPRWGQ